MVAIHQDTQNRTPNPFGQALQVARLITSRMPRDEQAAELDQLRTAMAQLDENGRKSLVFRLLGEMMEDETPVQGLFAAAGEARMISVAHNGAALKKAMREGDLSLTDLRNMGLAEIKVSEDGRKAHVVYKVGHVAIEEGVKRLREAGKTAAAQVLEAHLKRAEKGRLFAEARNAARNSVPTTPPTGQDAPPAEAPAEA